MIPLNLLFATGDHLGQSDWESNAFLAANAMVLAVMVTTSPGGNMTIWEKASRMCFAPPTWIFALYCQTRMLSYYEKDSFVPESIFNTPRQIKSFPSFLP